MTIEPLGELKPDPSIREGLVSAEVNVNYFPDTRLRFILEDIACDPTPAEFVAAIRNFLELTVQHRAEAAPYVFKNYSDFAEVVEEDEVDVSIAAPSDVWKHVHPTEIHVLRRAYGDKKVYVTVSAACDWEQEHGLQIVYCEGNQLNRVSDQDGHLTYSDAYGLPESEDRIC